MGKPRPLSFLKQKKWAQESFRCKFFSSPNGTKSVNTRVLIILKKDKSIIITRPDKGNGVVILNKKDYIEKKKKKNRENPKW